MFQLTKSSRRLRVRMGEIKRYSLEVNTGWDDEVVTKTFVLASEHEKALTKAKKETVREWLENVDKTHTCDKCSIRVYCKTSETCIREDVMHDLIKKVEGI